MKGGTVRLGTIAGIPLELHFSWAMRWWPVARV